MSKLRLITLLLLTSLFSFSITTAEAFTVACGDVQGLRDALNAANDETAHPGEDTISLAAGCTYLLNAFLPSIESTIVINGNGATLDGNSSFEIFAIAPAGVLTVDSVTIQGGHNSWLGGGITNVGTLIVKNSLLRNNVSDGTGGGLYNASSAIVMSTTFENNSALGGGAIANTTEMHVFNSTFTQNEAAHGGAIASNYILTVTNSTFYDNHATNSGGAIDLSNPGNSTLIQYTTIAQNSAPVGGGISFGMPAPGTLFGSVLDNAPSSNCEMGPDVTIEYSIVTDASCGLSGTHLYLVEDAGLGTFGNHGGTTATIDLLSGSAAINRIPAELCTELTDQRGVSRPYGGACDAGAFEANTPTPTASPTATSTPTATSAPTPNLIQNGNFSNGMTSWLTYAVPANGIIYGVYDNVLHFYRALNAQQAVVLQNTGVPLPQNAPLEVTLSLGNNSPNRKRAVILMHDQDFSDLQVCSFWLAPHSPLRTYIMRGATTEAWIGATLSIYASPNDGLGWIQVDNVSMYHRPELNAAEVTCVDPTAPAPTAAADSPNLLQNADFSSGMNRWATWDAITYRINSGIFEFYRNVGGISAVVLQETFTAVPANTPFEAHVDLGNSSGVRKRAVLIVHDRDFSDLQVCSFWIPPHTPLSSFVMRSYTTEAWSNATFSVYASPDDGMGWLQVDNASLITRPGMNLTGTECTPVGSTLSNPSTVITPTNSNLSVIATNTETPTLTATPLVESTAEVTPEIVPTDTLLPTLAPTESSIPTESPVPAEPSPTNTPEASQTSTLVPTTEAGCSDGPC